MVFVHNPSSQPSGDPAPEGQQQTHSSDAPSDASGIPHRSSPPHIIAASEDADGVADHAIGWLDAPVRSITTGTQTSRSASDSPPFIAGTGRSREVSGKVPVPDVARLRSFFDLAGSAAACSTSFNHGREFGGKSGILALQVSASSLPPPLNASVVVESDHMASSGAFFPAMHTSDSRLLHASTPIPTNKTDSSAFSSRLREGVSARGNRAENVDLTRVPTASISRNRGEIFQWLSEVLQGDGDADLILQQEDRGNEMLQWLEALDHHVTGACRAEERLPPVLRWNVSCSGVDAVLITCLNQHFGAKELGMLARCLCTPLVNIRAGKVEQRGKLLYPSAIRGYLSLVMLPSSEMRLSFIGDNGVVNRIIVLKPGSDLSPLLEMLPADTSGRAFVIKLCNHNHYFWQSEKSKDAGDKLLSKIMDLLRQRPTLAQLTGIHESRLDSFVNQLRSAFFMSSSSQVSGESVFLTSSSTGNTTNSNSVACSSSAGSPILATFPRLSHRFCWNRASIACVTNSQAFANGRFHSGGQGSLSSRASGFKDDSRKTSTGAKLFISASEKHKRRIDIPRSLSLTNLASGSKNDGLHSSDNISDISNSSLITQRTLSFSDANFVTHNVGLIASLPPYACTRDCAVRHPKQIFTFPLVSSTCTGPPNLLPSLYGGLFSTSNLPHPDGETSVCLSSPAVSPPYYCPCPLRSSALQYTITPPFLPSSSDTSSLPASPSLYSIIPASTLLSQMTVSLDRVNISPVPVPASSLDNLQTPLQASSLPLLFSDPIVHIPVIDLESGSPSFFVSAPQAMSPSGIAPVLPSLFNSAFPGVKASVGGQALPESNNEDLGASVCWNNLENHGHDIDFFLMAARSRSLCLSKTDAKLVRAVKKLDSAFDFSKAKENEKLSGSSRCEGKNVVPTGDNLEAMSQHSDSLKAAVSTILTSGSVSCVLNFSEERLMNSTTWISGSRGLYGGACDPGSGASRMGMNHLAKLHGKEVSKYWLSEGDLADILSAHSSSSSEGLENFNKDSF